MTSHIGRYEILEEIGSGNYGRVYRARIKGAHGFEKVVALKILNTTINTHNKKEVRALINEARIGGFLKHSGIVDTYEFGEVEGKLYIAMEYVDGITLGHLIRGLRTFGRFLPISLVIEIGYSVAASLAYAHEREDDENNNPLHLVHRDLKPENIMLSASGEVKILDFGIAVSAANMFRTTLKNMTKGTPAYMSPEQVMGVRDLDARSDLFGIGAVLVETTTTQQLFDGNSWTDTMELVLRKDITSALGRVAGSSAELADLLERMLQRDRNNRIASARNIARELLQMRVRYPVAMTLAECVTAIRTDDWNNFPDSFMAARDWRAPDPTLPPMNIGGGPNTDSEISLPKDGTLSDILTKQVEDLLASRGSDPTAYRPGATKRRPPEPDLGDRLRGDSAPYVSGRPHTSAIGLDPPNSITSLDSDSGSHQAPKPSRPPAGTPSTEAPPPVISNKPSSNGSLKVMARQRNTIAVFLVLQTIVLVAVIAMAAVAWNKQAPKPAPAENPAVVANDTSSQTGSRNLLLRTQPSCSVLVKGEPVGITNDSKKPIELPEGISMITLDCPSAGNYSRDFPVAPTGDMNLRCWNAVTDSECKP